MKKINKNSRKSITGLSPKMNKKVKQKIKQTSNLSTPSIPLNHDFTEREILDVRHNLLHWYDENKRDLPWRNLAKISDVNERAYAVWVSEIMLQQTRVTTVISYYEKWMKLWPNIKALSKASLEEVNQVWSGLGYYSRGRRLHEGAKIVSEKWNGEMPKTAEKLQKLPGIGRYTASAIASIAFNEAVGTVDGNIFRVMSRLRTIGKEISSQETIDATWFLTNKLVDPERPGDFNQAMMELGATVCLPKNPLCHSCPVKSNCKAYQKVENLKVSSKKILLNSKSTKAENTVDIEDCAENCQLCLPDSDRWDAKLGVENYPRILKKQPGRKERTFVMIFFRNKPKEEFYLVQRPQKGLLANLWEFPTVLLEEHKTELSSKQNDDFAELYGFKRDGTNKKHKIGEVVHIFSHIHQTYAVYRLELACEEEWNNLTFPENYQGKGWFTKEELETAAISTAMRKVFNLFESTRGTETKSPSQVNKRKRNRGTGETSPSKKRQTTLAAFFRNSSS